MTDGLALGRLLAAANEEFDDYAERILEAARGLYLEFGMRRTSLDDVARAARVGRATLFRRFPNRAALDMALAAREAQAAISKVDQQVVEIEDPEEFLVTAALAVIHQITGNELLQRLLVTDPEMMLPLLTGRGAPILAMGSAYTAQHLRRLQDQGTEIAGDPAVISELLGRITLSLALNPESVLPLENDDEMKRITRATILPMILRSAA